MSGNYAEINERLMTQRLSALGVLLPISVLEKSVHDPRCVVTAEALRNPITMLANHTLPYPAQHRSQRELH